MHDLRISPQRLRVARPDDLPLFHHEMAIGQIEQGPQVLIDHDHRQPLGLELALLTNPRLIVLDEATEGLATLIRTEIWNALGELKAEGLSMIVIDKNLGPLLDLADRHFVLEKGQVVWSGDSTALRADPRIVHEYLGV